MTDFIETLNGEGVGEQPDASAPSVQRMAVRIGDLGLLMPWDGGREVMPAPSASRIPNTVSWLRGIANVRGALVPVVDLAMAFGVTRASVPSYLLICGQGDDAMGLLIDGLPRVFDVAWLPQLPEQQNVPALLRDSVVAAIERDGRLWLDVDLDTFFKTLGHELALTGRLVESISTS